MKYGCLLTVTHAARPRAELKNMLTVDDGQPDLPSGGHAEPPGGGQRDYLV